MESHWSKRGRKREHVCNSSTGHLRFRNLLQPAHARIKPALAAEGPEGRKIHGREQDDPRSGT
nr:MAG TPA: hypothetical protein [Caudoviricetes sp.]